MIRKNLPGFSFKEPKNRNVINIRITSVDVSVGTRPIRAIWNPGLAQDLQAFHAIDTEAELTALLGQEIANEIDNQIIQDLNNNQRFYNQNTVADVINRWTNIHNDVLINQAHQPIGELNHPNNGFDNLVLPHIRRVAARTIGLDLVNVQPLNVPTGLLTYLDFNVDNYTIEPNYTVLPNDEGWYTNDTFESIMIKMDMKPFKFITPIRRRPRRRRPGTPRIY